jgi:hypothetical protein
MAIKNGVLPNITQGTPKRSTTTTNNHNSNNTYPKSHIAVLKPYSYRPRLTTAMRQNIGNNEESGDKSEKQKQLTRTYQLQIA